MALTRSIWRRRSRHPSDHRPPHQCVPHRRPLRIAVSGAIGSFALLTTALVAGLAPAALAGPTAPGSADIGNVLIVLDASGSMLEPDRAGQQKISGAKTAITTLVGGLPEGVPMGLRVFGESAALGANATSCTDSRLAQAVRPLSAQQMSATVNSVRARGWTPIGYALRSSAKDIPGAGRSSIVLVSDGIDECYPQHGPEPCQVASELTRAAIDLRVHTIGFTVDDRAREQLQCIAKVTGGRYWDAEDTSSLADALRQSILPPPPRDNASEAPPNPLGALVVFAVVGAGALAIVAGVRSMLRRRQRAYW